MNIANVPEDCLATILSFLALKDCIWFGSTSVACLNEILPDILRRRNRMIQRFCWNKNDPNTLHRFYHRRKNTMEDDEEGDEKEEGEDDNVLPTVKERIEGLWKSFPRNHPSKPMICELLMDLETNPTIHHHDSSYVTTMNVYQKVIRSLKLHSQLLTGVILSNPKQCYNSSNTNTDQRSRVLSSSVTGNQNHFIDNEQLCVELERYIGDVLIAQCFMGNSIAGIVEGAPIACEEKWIQKIFEDINLIPREEDKQNIISPNVWYRFWVFLHSTILRTAPFSRRQMDSLGLLPSHHFHQHYDCTTPLLPFVGTRKFHWMTYLTQHHLEAIRITYNQFGTLGPTFRGRDRVQSFVVDPLTAIDIIIKFDALFEKSKQSSSQNSINIDSTSSPLHNRVLQSWLTERDPNIRWILDSHAEVTKTRPMTVSPPLVVINSTSY